MFVHFLGTFFYLNNSCIQKTKGGRDNTARANTIVGSAYVRRVRFNEFDTDRWAYVIWTTPCGNIVWSR